MKNNINVHQIIDAGFNAQDMTAQILVSRKADGCGYWINIPFDEFCIALEWIKRGISNHHQKAQEAAMEFQRAVNGV